MTLKENSSLLDDFFTLNGFGIICGFVIRHESKIASSQAHSVCLAMLNSYIPILWFDLKKNEKQISFLGEEFLVSSVIFVTIIPICTWIDVWTSISSASFLFILFRVSLNEFLLYAAFASGDHNVCGWIVSVFRNIRTFPSKCDSYGWSSYTLPWRYAFLFYPRYRWPCMILFMMHFLFAFSFFFLRIWLPSFFYRLICLLLSFSFHFGIGIEIIRNLEGFEGLCTIFSACDRVCILRFACVCVFLCDFGDFSSFLFFFLLFFLVFSFWYMYLEVFVLYFFLFLVAPS